MKFSPHGGGDGGHVADVLHHGGQGDGGHDQDGGDVKLGHLEGGQAHDAGLRATAVKSIRGMAVCRRRPAQ